MERPGRRRTAVEALALVTLLALVSACEAADREAGEEGDAAPAAGSPGDTGAAAGALPDTAAELEPVVELRADTVQVTLTEYSIEMPETLPEGRTVFLITNAGGMDHTFEIAMESPEARLEPPAAPGETKVLTFEMSRGVWEVYCPIGNHRQQGMEREIRVGG